jgi:hypothetical protein
MYKYTYIYLNFCLGWGIQLGSLAFLHNLFNVSDAYATKVTAIYISCYAVGRLFAGVLAENIGILYF